MNNTVSLGYYSEFVDANGLKHYAYHKYNGACMVVTSMRDYKFDDYDYSKNCIEDLPIPRFYLEVMEDGYDVVDRSLDKTISTFYDKQTAKEYCDFLNSKEIQDETFEDYDDPWH